MDRTYDKNLNFDRYTNYGNNLQKYNDPLYVAQYTNFKNQMDNYNNDITNSNVFMSYLNNNKKLLNNDNSANNIRQIEINNYYTSKYNSESNILKNVVMFCCLALVGSLFFLKGVISESLYIVYLGILLFIGFITVVYGIYNLYFRDNIKFDEYDFQFMKAPGNDMPSQKVDEPTPLNDHSVCL